MLEFTPQQLRQLVSSTMPFGKYRGRLLLDLPVAYLAWFVRQELADSELSRQLQLLYQLKMDGNGDILRRLQHQLSLE